MPVSYDKFALSVFDLNKKKIINKIFESETNKDYSGTSNYIFNYCLIGDNFIYQICDCPYDDYDIYEKDKKSLSFNFNIYNIKKRNNIKDLKTSFRLISYFKDNLVFAEENKSLNVCYFENNNFSSIYKFDLYFNASTLCILKNYDIIVWEDPLSCQFYYYYEYLNK